MQLTLGGADALRHGGLRSVHRRYPSDGGTAMPRFERAARSKSADAMRGDDGERRGDRCPAETNG